MGKREEIISAAKDLFWERGYEATSPRDIQEKSNAGQGSFYHHFRTKSDLAVAVMNEVVEDRIASFEALLAGAVDAKEKMIRFLNIPKEPFAGCRIGRMVWDSAIDDEGIRQPLSRYFRHIEERLVSDLERDVLSGKLQCLLGPRELVLILLAAVQGSFTVSRATLEDRVGETTSSLIKLVENTVKPV